MFSRTHPIFEIGCIIRHSSLSGLFGIRRPLTIRYGEGSQGACHDRFWPQDFLNDKPTGTNWIVDAFQTPLGAYYRVDHHSVADLQAAINETGVVFVTAQIHEGWHLPVDGLISLNPGAVTIGGMLSC